MKLSEKFLQSLVALQTFVHRPWYVPLIAVLALLDSFLLIFPIDILLIACVMIRRKRWFGTSLMLAVGSALGVMLLAGLIAHNQAILDSAWVQRLFPPESISARAEMVKKYGPLGIGLIAVSPMPPQPAAIVGALGRMSLIGIFSAVFIARVIKYSVYSAIAAHAPHWLMKVRSIREHLEKLNVASHPEGGAPITARNTKD